MKFLYWFLFSTLASVSLRGIEHPPRTTCYSLLSRFVYRSTSLCMRNDYLYLAYADACWRLRVKLQLQDNIEDINRYYLRCGATFNTVSNVVYLSPLHQAVLSGNLSAVIILCNAGADKELIIRSHVKESGLAEERYPRCPWMSMIDLAGDKVEQHILRWKQSNYVGFSAVKLAEVLSQGQAPGESYNRQCIYEFLKTN